MEDLQEWMIPAVDFTPEQSRRSVATRHVKSPLRQEEEQAAENPKQIEAGPLGRTARDKEPALPAPNSSAHMQTDHPKPAGSRGFADRGISCETW